MSSPLASHWPNRPEERRWSSAAATPHGNSASDLSPSGACFKPPSSASMRPRGRRRRRRHRSPDVSPRVLIRRRPTRLAYPRYFRHCDECSADLPASQCYSFAVITDVVDVLTKCARRNRVATEDLVEQRHARTRSALQRDRVIGIQSIFRAVTQHPLQIVRQ